MTTSSPTNLDDLAPPRLEQALGTIVSPPFRVKQIEEWMYVHGVDVFDAMTNIPKELRSALAEHYTIAFPEVVERTTPAADGSQKYLFTLRDGDRIEAVYMPMGDRTSVCLSSQAGCAVGCTFCVTGFFGVGRNLSPGEMLGQFFTIQHEHSVPMETMDVVLMGMGEPLLKFVNLVTTRDGLYRNIAPKRHTCSTAGLRADVYEWAKQARLGTPRSPTSRSASRTPGSWIARLDVWASLPTCSVTAARIAGWA